jgi:hypothetical protein
MSFFFMQLCSLNSENVLLLAGCSLFISIIMESQLVILSFSIINYIYHLECSFYALFFILFNNLSF